MPTPGPSSEQQSPRKTLPQPDRPPAQDPPLPQLGPIPPQQDPPAANPDTPTPPDPIVRRRRTSIPVFILAMLAVTYTMALAKPVLLPIAAAWLFKTALAPVVKFTRRLGLSPSVSAALIVLLLTGACAGAVYELTGPASEWAQRLPNDVYEIRAKLEQGMGNLKAPFEKMSEAGKAVSEITEGDNPDDSVEVKIVDSGPVGGLLGNLWQLTVNGAVMLVLLYFMLATGDAFLVKLVESLPRLSDAKAAVTTFRAIELNISRYLLTISLINLCLGALVAITCWWFELPYPILWGLMAAVFNFVPYLGALFGVIILAAVGITTHDTLLQGLSPALTYAAINTFEGMVITPLILGRRFSLSPVILFTWLLLMGWLWGIPGALLAVPLLATAKIVCDNLPRLETLSRFLSA